MTNRPHSVTNVFFSSDYWTSPEVKRERWRPRWRPDGDVVVISHHCLNSF